MAGIGFLHRIDCERPDGIDAEAIEPLFVRAIVCRGIAFRIRCQGHGHSPIVFGPRNSLPRACNDSICRHRNGEGEDAAHAPAVKPQSRALSEARHDTERPLIASKTTATPPSRWFESAAKIRAISVHCVSSSACLSVAL